MIYKVKVIFINGKEVEYDNIAQINENIDTFHLYSNELICDSTSKNLITLIKNNILSLNSIVIALSEEDKKRFKENEEIFKKYQERAIEFEKLREKNYKQSIQMKKEDINYIH